LLPRRHFMLKANEDRSPVWLQRPEIVE